MSLVNIDSKFKLGFNVDTLRSVAPRQGILSQQIKAWGLFLESPDN